MPHPLFSFISPEQLPHQLVTEGSKQNMGMFDKPQYLTGEEGFVKTGETFWLHNARLDGTVVVSGQAREQAKLEVSHDRDGAREIVFTSGTGIVGQVRRMDDSDRARMPMELRLDQVPSKQQGRNPTNVLTPASEAPPSEATPVAEQESF